MWYTVVSITTGEFIVSGSGDGSVCLWSLLSFDCLHLLEGHTDAVNTVVVKVQCVFIEYEICDLMFLGWVDNHRMLRWPCESV